MSKEQQTTCKSTEEFETKLTITINKGGWGKENLKDALPIIEAYFQQRINAITDEENQFLETIGSLVWNDIPKQELVEMLEARKQAIKKANEVFNQRE